MLMGKPLGKPQLSRSKRRCEDNIKTILSRKGIGFENGEWIELAQDRVQWQVLVLAV